MRALASWSVRTYLVFVLLGLIVGGLAAPLAVQTDAGGDGTIAVVAIDGAITGAQVERYQEHMTRARSEADAVVLIANSGGGSASASESMYLQTKRTAARIPVVTAIDAGAASGAYYAIAPSDRIYVKPASIVGSVGVVATVPPSVEPNDLIGTTGPDKLTGGDGRAFFYTLDTIQGAFLNAVVESRGDRLRLDRTEVAQARTYAGVTAVKHGLADEVGDRGAAIRAAAELAGLERPRVVVYDEEGAERQFLLRSTYLASGADSKRLIDGGPAFGQPDGLPSFLMVPPGVIDVESTAVATTEGDSVRLVGPADGGNRSTEVDADA